MLFLNLCAWAKGYDMSVPLNGDSIASDSLQFIIVKDIYSKLSKKLPDCYDYYVSNTQLIHYPYDVVKKKNGKYKSGYWKEMWSVSACGRVIQYPITFYIKGDTADYLIEDIQDKKY